ncbi:MAG: ATP-binding protein [Rubrivivax sp.]|nr:ATP-binding protein [Rubrivivax sp.]
MAADTGIEVNRPAAALQSLSQQHLEQLVLERTAELQRNSERLAETQFAMDRAGICIAWTTVNTARFLYVNDQACSQLGYTRQEMLALCVPDINPARSPSSFRQLQLELGDSDHLPPWETVLQRKDGSRYPVEVKVYLRRSPGQDSFIFFFGDITERKRAQADADARLAELRRNNRALEELNGKLTQAHGQLLQSEKMASIGQLSAGVAHEINNPIGYVKSNLNSLVRYVDDLERVLDSYAQAEGRCTGQEAHFADLHQVKTEVEFDFVREDLRSLLSESVAGLDRVTRIVQNLKDFSHVDCDESWAMEDLHRGIDSTLNVIWNHLKYNCEVKKEYGDLPPVECLLSQLNQIFLNLLVNAADAIEGKGTITIRTGVSGDQVWVEVADTGKGIPAEKIRRIFEPFFTTKPVGKGTGLGLSVSYSIVHKHHGRIEVDSVVGQGSTFRVWLPLKQPALQPEDQPA